LFSNAIKFSPAGGQVSLDLFVEHGEVVVQIADTGIGIPSADLPRVFDRFYRSELTVQREIPGTGLGLAISHEILKRHQGAIEVQSEVDKGTIFRVRLPLAREQRPQILLLDGAPGCLPAIRPVLDSEYHLVSTAHPTEALHLAKEAAPSLLMVVLDDAAADRVALIHSLRAAVHSRHIPILAISTGSHEMADQALLAGADDFITHPVSPAVLLGTTARLLSSSRAGRGTV
jgi:PleD family two-component response regulator